MSELSQTIDRLRNKAVWGVLTIAIITSMLVEGCSIAPAQAKPVPTDGEQKHPTAAQTADISTVAANPTQAAEARPNKPKETDVKKAPDWAASVADADKNSPVLQAQAKVIKDMYSSYWSRDAKPTFLGAGMELVVLKDKNNDPKKDIVLMQEKNGKGGIYKYLPIGDDGDFIRANPGKFNQDGTIPDKLRPLTLTDENGLKVANVNGEIVRVDGAGKIVQVIDMQNTKQWVEIAKEQQDLGQKFAERAKQCEQAFRDNPQLPNGGGITGRSEFKFETPVSIRLEYSGNYPAEKGRTYALYQQMRVAGPDGNKIIKDMEVGKVVMLAGKWRLRVDDGKGNVAETALDGSNGGISYDFRGRMQVADEVNPDKVGRVNPFTGKKEVNWTEQRVGTNGKAKLAVRGDTFAEGALKLTNDPEKIDKLHEYLWKSLYALNYKLKNAKDAGGTFGVPSPGQNNDAFMSRYPDWKSFKTALDNDQVNLDGMAIPKPFAKGSEIRKFEASSIGVTDTAYFDIVHTDKMSSATINLSTIPEAGGMAARVFSGDNAIGQGYAPLLENNQSARVAVDNNGLTLGLANNCLNSFTVPTRGFDNSLPILPFEWRNTNSAALGSYNGRSPGEVMEAAMAELMATWGKFTVHLPGENPNNHEIEKRARSVYIGKQPDGTLVWYDVTAYTALYRDEADKLMGWNLFEVAK